MNDRIDDALRARVSADPPPELVDRVLARVRDTAPAPHGLFALPWRPIGAVSLATAAALALVLHAKLPQAPDANAVVSWQSPTAALLQPVR